MKEYLKHQRVIARKPKSKLVRNLILLGVIGVGLGGVALYSLKHSNYETIVDKRARYLNTANEQMLQTQKPETINGLNSVITDIGNGVYDHSK